MVLLSFGDSLDIFLLVLLLDELLFAFELEGPLLFALGFAHN